MGGGRKVKLPCLSTPLPPSMHVIPPTSSSSKSSTKEIPSTKCSLEKTFPKPKIGVLPTPSDFPHLPPQIEKVHKKQSSPEVKLHVIYCVEYLGFSAKDVAFLFGIRWGKTIRRWVNDFKKDPENFGATKARGIQTNVSNIPL